MPQMAPLWWTFMMMIFISVFLLAMMNLYFNYNKKMEGGILLLTKKNNWQW